MSRPYNVYQWWINIVETRVLTEDGAYAQGQVPETYAGSQITVDIIQRTIFTNSAGEIFELRMDTLDGVKDNQEKSGLGAHISNLVLKYDAYLKGAGPSTGTVTWKAVLNPRLPARTAAKAAQMYTAMISKEGTD